MTTEPFTLASLAQRPLWVAWQQEDRPDGKATKVPYSPNGKKARADTPSTWGLRPDAERRAAVLPKPYGLGGVGIELAPLGDGRSLAGIDLDTCRSAETGKLEAWAEDVLASFDSYSEVSPSATGVKLFLTYDTDALPDLQAHMGASRFGKQFKRGGGDHPPAIELHLGNRYFAVTDLLLPDTAPDLRHVEPATILHLLQIEGPAFARPAGQSGTGRKERRTTGADGSRSTSAFKVGQRAVRDGANYEQMCETLRGHADTAEWMREKGDANSGREARRIFDKATGAGPLIRVAPGELHLTATAGEAAIIEAGLPIYQRGNSLVRPVVQEVAAAHGRVTLSAGLHEIEGHGLLDALCKSATWEKFDARAEDFVRINPPRIVADIILSRAGLWAFPKVVGVVTTPTIRPDGSILSAPGYDPATRLYHWADVNLVLSQAVQKPTRESAVKALALLSDLLAEFPFVDNVGRAVALSGLITPVVRGALAAVPLHAFRANAPGSGKSYLVDCASAISSGRPCPVAAAGSDEAETEKRLTGLLLAGFPIASLDNVNGELGGDLLCQAIERPFIRLRPLGRSDIMEVESRATLFATGNGLRVRGDMVRRTLVGDLDAELERPELRPFKGNPVATVMAKRGLYVSACLIVVRAYILAGRPGILPPIASFTDWSDTVRSALVWLGCADPAASMETAREDDPELAELREIVEVWKSSLPVGQAMTCKQVSDWSDGKKLDEDGRPTSDWAWPDLRDLLLRIGGDRGAISMNRLGAKFRKHEGRIVSGHRIKRDTTIASPVARWKLEAIIRGG